MEACNTAMESVEAWGDGSRLASLQSTIILLANSVYEQGQSFFLGHLVLQVIKSRMSSDDLNMLRFVKVELGESQMAALKTIQMDWPVGVTSIAENPQPKALGRLVKSLRNTSLDSSSDNAGV